ncbi:MAG: hypothetical protein PSV17_04195 [Methylotenera sp.]|uniref:hypothetical protein n=1 Tax=Methylotenera sp. TaxID=2051956 RepID=UPI002487A881|nr:hypothetical protein [Methylotenera sp.]MDI1308620.1 hypothetical protein [Methylotenera sp.]
MSNPVAPNRIVKIGTTTNVSGKHKITYHIGCNAEHDIYFRVYENSGGGFFSTEWISFKTVQQAIEQGRKPTTSFVLYGIFNGKSVNTPAFLLAALLKEGLVGIHEDNQRCYAATDPDPFITQINLLIASDTNIQVEPKPRKKHKRVELFEAGPVKHKGQARLAKKLEKLAANQS